jgi:hypothetical protein
MWRPCRKTVAALVGGCDAASGSWGVLALGRAMDGPRRPSFVSSAWTVFWGTGIWKRMRSAKRYFTRPSQGHVVALAGWTDRHGLQQSVLALRRSGRALPLYSITVHKGDGSETAQSGDGTLFNAWPLSRHKRGPVHWLTQ